MKQKNLYLKDPDLISQCTSNFKSWVIFDTIKTLWNAAFNHIEGHT